MTREINAYPWERLPRLELRAIAARRELLRRVFSALDVKRLGGALSQLLGDDYQNDFSLPGTESQRAFDTLRERAPEQGNDTVQVVLRHPGGLGGNDPSAQAVRPLSETARAPARARARQ